MLGAELLVMQQVHWHCRSNQEANLEEARQQ